MKDQPQCKAVAEAHIIGPNAPLRLKIAAALAYPDGSMTASGLRREAGRGRLVIERTAGKDYTTLGGNRSHEGIMPRTASGPHLWLRKERRDKRTGRVTHNAVWLIIDGKAQESTGAAEQTVTELRERLSATLTSSTPTPQQRASVTPLR